MHSLSCKIPCAVDKNIKIIIITTIIVWTCIYNNDFHRLSTIYERYLHTPVSNNGCDILRIPFNSIIIFVVHDVNLWFTYVYQVIRGIPTLENKYLYYQNKIIKYVSVKYISCRIKLELSFVTRISYKYMTNQTLSLFIMD